MMAAFGSNKSPTLITDRLSSMKTGDHPAVASDGIKVQGIEKDQQPVGG
jgi:hypothetical protein